jgi:DNA-binding protein HU-beta
MNKTDLIATVSNKTGISKKDVGTMVNEILSTITNELTNGGKVSFINFGTFSTTKRAGREGIKPTTGEKIFIEPAIVAKFKIGGGLKNAVKRGNK